MPESLSALIVDDEPAICRLLVTALERDGWLADAVPAAEDALAILGRARFDALIIDKNLPGMDGVELARRVRANDKRIMCAIITACGTSESAIDALNLGIDAYIEKPIEDITALVARLRGLVNRRLASLAPATREPQEPCPRAAVISPDAKIRDEVVALLRDDCDAIQPLASASAALATLAPDMPHLLVIDAAIDNPSVAQLLGALGSKTQQTRYVVLTDPGASLIEVVEYVELGVNAVLHKPINVTRFDESVGDLLAEIHEVIGSKAKRRRPVEDG